MVDENTIKKIIDWLCKNKGNYILVSVNFYEKIRDKIVEEIEERNLILEVGHHGFANFVDPYTFLNLLKLILNRVNSRNKILNILRMVLKNEIELLQYSKSIKNHRSILYDFIKDKLELRVDKLRRLRENLEEGSIDIHKNTIEKLKEELYF